MDMVMRVRMYYHSSKEKHTGEIGRSACCGLGNGWWEVSFTADVLPVRARAYLWQIMVLVTGTKLKYCHCDLAEILLASLEQSPEELVDP